LPDLFSESHMSKKTCVMLAMMLLSSLVAVAHAAPTGKIYFDPSGQVSSADNVLLTTGSQSSEAFTITFKNDAGALITDVGSTLQYITLAAADTNPSRAQIDLGASWKIFNPSGNPRTSGSVTGSLDDNAIYSPYSTSQPVYIYTWPIPQTSPYTATAQFEDSLQVLRPGEFLNLTITIRCQGVVGDSRIWFFFRATEAAYATGSYPTDISTIDAQYRMNLYYSSVPRTTGGPFWLPLHNSYDPYDTDIATGHNFDQFSWTRGATTTAFAKSNKLVHQKPPETPPPDVACIVIVKSGPATAQVGQTITYDYTVTTCETATVALTVQKTGGVTDSLGMAVNYVSGDTNNDGKLDTTETWLFTSTYTVQQDDIVDGKVPNTATVTGTSPTAETKTAVDDFYVTIVTELPLPCISIVKGGPATVQVGQTIKYDYIVTSCGAAALTVQKTGGVTDSLGMAVNYVSGDTNNDGKLDTTETWLFTSTYTVKQNDPDPLLNTATVTGTPPVGNPVSDTDGFSATIAAGQGLYSFHICGTKFVDLNSDGRYDPASEPGMDGVTVTFLGPDRMTKATAYYTELSYPPPEDKTPDVLLTGENMLHGSYCFNLVAGEAATGKTYTFYIQIEGQLIGPITLVATEDGPRESLNHDLGNAPPPPPAVGGSVLQVDNLELVTPWMGLFSLLGVVIALVLVSKKHRN
jgi:hypothetical protein